MKKKIITNSVRACSLSLIGLAGVSAAISVQAQTEGATSGGLEEVVVTAQRRAQDLQDVPFAVSAFTDDDIAKRDLDDFLALEGQVPGLLVSGDERLNLFVRGIGVDGSSINAEAGVPINIDGVYMSRNTIGGSVYSDLASIEVLRGPQGTLYGRNATGGTVNFWTKKPGEEFGGRGSLLFGNAQRVRAQGAVNVPLVPNVLSARIAAAYEEHDGYRRDVFRGINVDEREHQSLNASLRWTPTDNFEALFRVNLARNDNGGPVTQFLEQVGPFNPISTGGQTSEDPQNVRHNFPTRSQVDLDIYSATLTWDMEDYVFKSVTALQKHSWERQDDNEGSTSLWIRGDFDDESEGFTQEFTVASAGDGNIEWVAGVWYYDDEAVGDYAFALAQPPFPPVFPPQLAFIFDQETTAWAGFGQATWQATDRLRVTGGARYTYEEKSFVCNAGEFDETWTNFTPKASVDFTATDNVMLYASASKGFKAGGANFTDCTALYDEEELWAYEAGFKSELFDNRMRFNVNAFYYDYTGLQVNQFVQNAIAVTNAGEAEITGLEFEMLARPAEGWSIDANLSLQDSELLDLVVPDTFTQQPVDLEGNEVPRVAGLSWMIGAEYTTPFIGSTELTFRFEHRYTGDNYFAIFNEEFEEQEAFGMSNARMVLTQTAGSLAGMEVHLFINNIEDEDVLRRITASRTQGGTIGVYQDPQHFGIEFRFGG